LDAAGDVCGRVGIAADVLSARYDHRQTGSGVERRLADGVVIDGQPTRGFGQRGDFLVGADAELAMCGCTARRVLR